MNKGFREILKEKMGAQTASTPQSDAADFTADSTSRAKHSPSQKANTTFAFAWETPPHQSQNRRAQSAYPKTWTTKTRSESQSTAQNSSAKTATQAAKTSSANTEVRREKTIEAAHLTASEREAWAVLVGLGAVELKAAFSRSQVKKAFRRLAKQLHPDRAPVSSAQFIACKKAYDVLLNAKAFDTESASEPESPLQAAS